jgi:hypothetical protein
MTGGRFNPFREVIVSDARRPEPVVTGLNDLPIRKLRERMSPLLAGDPPWILEAAARALLVSSEAPGYGKSHLISRLFREMHGRASVIYVQPFQNTRTPFQSLMLALVRELHFPDREGPNGWNQDDPSQLDLLAHGVLAHLVADLIEGAVEGFQINAVPGMAAKIRADPLGAFLRGRDPWAEWLVEHWEKFERVFEPALARRGVRVQKAGPWLRVLRVYAFAPFDPVLRRICTDWICGEPSSQEEASGIGLRASDLISGDISPEETNEICRERLHDICELASFFRPFIFCFDQTEVYCGSVALARVFGAVVATLVNEMRGHIVLVTANQRPWQDRLSPHIEDADRQRFDPPILLEGLNRSQAEELVRLRMRAVNCGEAEIPRFLEGKWLSELFPAETSQMGARAFLETCRERWNPEETADLEALYRERKDQILAAPKRHVFEPDTLQWLIEVAANGLPGIEVESIQEKYAAVKWKTSRGACFFGFLPGSNWRQWLAVARTGESLAPCKYVFFRVPGQPLIPGPAWRCRDEIERAKAGTLEIIRITIEELAELYAPRDLYADAAQGDIPFTTQQVIDFLQKHLTRYWMRFQEPIARPRPAEEQSGRDEDIPRPGPLAEEIRLIVEEARFLSLEELIGKLNRPEATREMVLEAVGYCSHIRLHSHPTMTVLQWQRSA